jgi:hypothetical protein
MTVLLDIDGVLVTTPGWRVAEQHSDGFLKFNQRALMNLVRLITETKASIVLTSTHRITFSNEEWKEIFNARGIPVDNIQKVNEIHTVKDMMDRASEIKEWINNLGEHGSFVIIDDDLSLHSLPTDLKNKWVRTRSLIGLDEEGTNKAITILLGS